MEGCYGLANECIILGNLISDLAKACVSCHALADWCDCWSARKAAAIQ
jgi:hypothetical protein